MEQFGNLKSVMETRDHSKNGASLKSQMSKEKLCVMRKFVTLFLIIFLLGACTTKTINSSSISQTIWGSFDVDVVIPTGTIISFVSDKDCYIYLLGGGGSPHEIRYTYQIDNDKIILTSETGFKQEYMVKGNALILKETNAEYKRLK